MNPKVTVVIPFYNCPYIGRAIRSVLDQTYPNLEIIVVDDGSVRHTELIAPYMERLRYFRKANGGTASAMNAGILNATGEYVAWLSSDDMYKPDKIRRQLEVMEFWKADFCFTAYAVMDKDDVITESFAGTPLSAPGDIYRLLALYNPINGCTMMCRKEVFGRCGLFNESLPYTQDYEMWLRLAVSGVKLHYLPEALTMYRFHDQMGSIRYRPELLEEFFRVQSVYKERMQRLLECL
ncbi:glycosyltransferase [Paenibacillus sp. YN15]|uniref:glycosyltransferase family 2 protein n=1 Tax=Paenibacillus sp. YN15 TaxID=1742774 RepID=UPI000DCDFDA5|nr:glycosyltransferase [Paenibacillus sp. YN15]RAV01250.1 glycosyl transferase [Paenibacillus sp. YN15]